MDRSHAERSDFSLRTIMEGKRLRGRPRQMLLDWMMMVDGYKKLNTRRSPE